MKKFFKGAIACAALVPAVVGFTGCGEKKTEIKAPIITPIAISSALPLMANSLNSEKNFFIGISPIHI